MCRRCLEVGANTSIAIEQDAEEGVVILRWMSVGEGWTVAHHYLALLLALVARQDELRAARNYSEHVGCRIQQRLDARQRMR